RSKATSANRVFPSSKTIAYARIGSIVPVAGWWRLPKPSSFRGQSDVTSATAAPAFRWVDGSPFTVRSPRTLRFSAALDRIRAHGSVGNRALALISETGRSRGGRTPVRLKDVSRLLRSPGLETVV